VVMSGLLGPQSTDGEVALGVDTHLDFHVAVALDDLGRRLGELRVPTTTKGYKRLLCWAEEFGVVRCAGVEGTSSYGAGLARYLSAAWWQLRRSRGPGAVTSGATVSPTH
jgi:transposase